MAFVTHRKNVEETLNGQIHDVQELGLHGQKSCLGMTSMSDQKSFKNWLNISKKSKNYNKVQKNNKKIQNWLKISKNSKNVEFVGMKPLIVRFMMFKNLDYMARNHVYSLGLTSFSGQKN